MSQPPNPNEIRVGVFNCACGINIAGIIDVPALTEYAKTLPGVVMAEPNLSYCTTSGAAVIKKAVKEFQLNRIVVVA